MQELHDTLQHKSIIYITRDIERALGFDLDLPGYYIISNATDFAKQMQKEYPRSIFLIEEQEPMDTWQLLKHKKTHEYVSSIHDPYILVFKNTPQIERTCEEHGWKLLNPLAQLAGRVEEKIGQIEWLGELTKYLPNYSVQLCKDVVFDGTPFVLQFNRSHTGSGTIRITSSKQLADLQKQFPLRETRTATYIEGPLFTNNNIVGKDNILIGNICYQITGLQPFTDRPFATIGNDWGVVQKLLSPEQREQYVQIATDVGKKLHKDGWRGLFGIDVVMHEKTGQLYLLEINARQPASTTYESMLQHKSSLELRNNMSLTTFEAHMAATLDLNLSDYHLIPIHDGSQIIQRVTEKIQSIEIPQVQSIYSCIAYNNVRQGDDLLRIQFPHSIMSGHNELNEKGNELKMFVESQENKNSPDNIMQNFDDGTITSRDLKKHTPTELRLSNTSQTMIDSYLSLPFPHKHVNCPYFNNRRAKVRGALRVSIGKGTPQEIFEEAQLYAMREKIDMDTLTSEQTKEFLIAQNLGVDCSALAYHILDAEVHAREKGSLKKHLSFPYAKNPLRKLLTLLRPAENCGVSTLAHDANSIEISTKDIRPGDMIVFLHTGPRRDYNHIMIITDTEISNLTYVHSFQYPNDGPLHHGARKETITITDPNTTITEQQWNCEEMNIYRKTAQTIQIRRLKCFT